MFRNLLVPTDLSEGLRRAVDQALDGVRGEGGYVELLHVVDPQAAVDTMTAHVYP